MAAKSNHPYSKAIVTEYNLQLIELEVNENSWNGVGNLNIKVKNIN